MTPPNAWPRILALQGATSARIQATMAAFVARRRAEGVEVAGLIEERIGQEPDRSKADGAGNAGKAPGSGCTGYSLRELSGGRLFRIDQDLGPCATACHLDASGVVAACAALMDTIAGGCELAVISKFGKLEAERGGLGDAFAAAVGRGVPVLTAVAPSFAPAWARFAGPLAGFAPPDDAILDAWWHAVRAAAPAARIAAE
ncbi:DUF2478 domain-containing protein [Ancylobacter sp. 6x-1]|uniref:DUF2478 domain-containing protein n=1 Tax=Ancylobacter crimeensis TaxID=2579147 RepID=A0ABT0D9L8_9HYPH|nr:DUF2478 domain-containing protein [Ancylobacter crimeensis]MCK0196614.1 DUF2478 domain-containing protein [Ancylobacter crimeensis]